MTSELELEVVLPDESPDLGVDTLVDLARTAEELGYTTAWLPDHILPPGSFGPDFGGVYEPLLTLAHLAALTERLRFGTSVLIAPLRDPFLLAKQAATLHRLSCGRVTLGIGVGWNEPEFDALGADYQHRGAVTDDILDLLRHLFGGGGAPYRGRRFSYDQGVFEPVPDGGLPLMVGGNSDAALRRAARYADLWQGLPSSPEEFAGRVRRLAELAGDRDVEAALRIGWEPSAPVGLVAERVLAFRDAAATRVAVHFGEHDGTRTRMAALARAVLAPARTRRAGA